MFHGKETVLLKITLTETVLQMWECTATLYQICSIRMLSLKTQEILRVYAG